MPSIVTVNVSQQVAPIPATLQQTGAFLSQGGTTLAKNGRALITQLSDLTAIMPNTTPITSMTWLSNVVTVTLSQPHGLQNGDVVPVTIAGATPAGYNGTFQGTATGANTLTYPLTSNPGSATVTGVFTLEDVGELNDMATTFFAQGANQSAYVLELGPGTPAEGVTALTAYLTANINSPQPLPGNGALPSRFYSFLTPRNWASEATFQTLLASYANPSSKLYFFVTMTQGNYTLYTSLQKCVVGLIESPNKPAHEFSAAALFWASLRYRPSATNKVTPFAFTYVYGVTPYPVDNNSALLTTFKNAAVNVIGTGAEGGISNTIISWGMTKDGQDFTYWYSADWVQINVALRVANAVINGSNNSVNPLYYNQQGIDRLQAVITNTMLDGQTFGLVLGSPVQVGLDGPALDDAIDAGTYENRTIINAVPFIPYSNANPGDYALGLYSGFSTIYTPARGFIQIVFNLVISDFVQT